jgi:hypothetical protein
MRQFNYLLIFIVFACSPVQGQSGKEIAYSIEQIINMLAEEAGDEINIEMITEELFYLSENPANINNVEIEQLEKSGILNEQQINSIQSYIRRHRQLLSFYELQLIEHISTEDIRRMLPFVCISETTEPEQFKWRYLHKGHGQFYLRSGQVLEKQTGFTEIDDSTLLANPNLRYLGPSYSLNSKLSYKVANKLFLGLRIDKDAGEALFTTKKSKGFDFLSGHLEITNLGPVKRVNLGDFTARFGQGLTLWSGFPIFKSAQSSVNLKRFQSGTGKYTGSNENQFFRGAAICLEWRKLELSALYSSKYIDANLLMDTTDSREYLITSIQSSGIHATASQLEHKHSVKEQVIGSNFRIKLKQFSLGTSAVFYHLDKSFAGSTSLNNLYKQHASESYNLGLDYQFNILNFHFFGELAINENHNRAYINGLLFSPNSIVDIVLVNRSYPAGYHGYYQAAFGESAGNSNESGTYFAVSLKPFSGIRIDAYCDQYNSYWLRYNIDKPSKGTDYSAQCTYNMNSKTSVSIKAKLENSVANPAGSTEIMAKPSPKQVQSIRFNLIYRPLEELALQSRMESKRVKLGVENSSGYLALQDIKYKTKNLPLSIIYRFAIFDTEDYHSRIYSYEHDVLNSFSFPAYNSNGTRWYLLLKYSIASGADLWIRYSKTYYYDKSEIGSGLNLIEDNKKSDIKLVFRIRF